MGTGFLWSRPIFRLKNGYTRLQGRIRRYSVPQERRRTVPGPSIFTAVENTEGHHLKTRSLKHAGKACQHSCLAFFRGI